MKKLRNLLRRRSKKPKVRLSPPPEMSPFESVVPNYTIVKDSAFAEKFAMRMMEGYAGPEANLISEMGKPEDASPKIFLYNVSTKAHVVDRPGGHYTIHGRAEDAEYGRGPCFAGTVRFVVNRLGTGHVHYAPGSFIAQDILNPEDPKGNYETAGSRIQGPVNENTNLYRFGCFWSEHNPPKPSELALAREQLSRSAGRAQEIEQMVKSLDDAIASAKKTARVLGAIKGLLSTTDLG